jgi:hypothetical protein
MTEYFEDFEHLVDLRPVLEEREPQPKWRMSSDQMRIAKSGFVKFYRDRTDLTFWYYIAVANGSFYFLRRGRNRDQNVVYEGWRVYGHVTVCPYCGLEGTKSIGPDNKQWHIDHVIPLARGGKDHVSNVTKCCATCNLRKHTKTPAEFAKVLGRSVVFA